MAISTIKRPSCYQSTWFTSVTTESFTVNANAAKEITATGTLAGWYPVGVIGNAPASNTQIFPYGIEVTPSSGSVTVTAWVKNTSSSAVTDTRTFYVLWLKEI